MCVPDGDNTETEDALLAKAKKLHPDRQFADLSAANSHFRK
jgi:curved DNA-binding protein CbpA